MLKAKLLGATAAAEVLAIEDVFSTYLYTGNGSTQTITNDIDLAGEGGLVWIKGRSGATGHRLTDTARGATKSLESNSAGIEATESTGLTSFSSTGFALGADADYNTNAATYCSWTFRKAEKFFDVVTYTGTGAAQNIAHNLGSVPGCMIVKQTNGANLWTIYHRSVDAINPQNYGLWFQTNARDLDTYWNNTAPTSTVFTVGPKDGTNQSGGTYVAYLYAHDPLGPSGDGSDGLIACGSTDGSKVTLGWEPQWLLYRSSNFTDDWQIVDNMRGLPVGAVARKLEPNTADAEANTSNSITIAADGFTLGAISGTAIYIAIRRGPMREPESGTEVFAPKVVVGDRTGNHTIDGLGFAPDFVFGNGRGGDVVTYDKLRGANRSINTNDTSAETNDTSLAAFLNDGYFIGSNGGRFYDDGTGSITWSFRRAPGFFDVVAYSGTGATPTVISHNLKVVPEMMIIKSRTSNENWMVYHAALGNTSAMILTTSAVLTGLSTWNSTTPSATTFTLGGGANNGSQSGQNYIAYLFASLPGISKVGSYTGNGSSQTINCAFTTGARFVLIKRRDSTGDWYVWDTARGIVTGNDPHLSLNTTAAEVTSNDTIDPDSTGFIVNQVAATNVNVNAATYIFLAIA